MIGTVPDIWRNICVAALRRHPESAPAPLRSGTRTLMCRVQQGWLVGACECMKQLLHEFTTAVASYRDFYTG